MAVTCTPGWRSMNLEDEKKIGFGKGGGGRPKYEDCDKGDAVLVPKRLGHGFLREGCVATP